MWIISSIFERRVELFDVLIPKNGILLPETGSERGNEKMSEREKRILIFTLEKRKEGETK